MREIRKLLYERVNRIGKALASPRWLELFELLRQSEMPVEPWGQRDIGVKLLSAHLKELRAARLVEACKKTVGAYITG